MPISRNLLWEWERQLRKDAAADELVLFKDHLKRLELPEKPEDLLEGTILAVQACCAYNQVDGQSYGEFLAIQKYNPGEAPKVKYAFTLRVPNRFVARILTPKKVHEGLDLADLYNHPWHKYRICGYSEIWIARTDGRDLTAKESAMLEEQVADDLRFDYSEEELGFRFNDQSKEGLLYVCLYDVEEE